MPTRSISSLENTELSSGGCVMTPMSLFATSKSTAKCRYQLADKNRAKAHSMAMRSKRHYFKEWREYRGLTQEQVADRIDYSRNYYSEVEKGKKQFNEEFLYALAHAFSADPWELLRRNPLIPSNDVVDLLALIDEPDRAAAIRMLEAMARKKSA